jgi:stearoyl-CoA desaturase (delta-9 desaturase)
LDNNDRSARAVASDWAGRIIGVLAPAIFGVAPAGCAPPTSAILGAVDSATATREDAGMFIHYPSLIFLGAIHVMALVSLPFMYFHGIHAWEIVFYFMAYLLGGFGITALYHRAWTHNAVNFARPIEYMLATFAVLMIQMPARQWISTHIKHHKHTDHDDDPYNIQRGFWWAHFEWIIFAPVPPIEVPARLEGNPVIFWQERYYWHLTILLNVGIPIALSIAVGSPWWGGLLLSGLRLVLANHVVFAVNSVCHVWGSRPYTRDVSARNVWWFPFSLGEQYHNYHHAFPRDYRHGVKLFDFDPTKWLIGLLAYLGLARNLFAMPAARIQESRRSSSQSSASEK